MNVNIYKFVKQNLNVHIIEGHEYVATATADVTTAFEDDKKYVATCNMILYITCDECEYI